MRRLRFFAFLYDFCFESVHEEEKIQLKCQIYGIYKDLNKYERCGGELKCNFKLVWCFSEGVCNQESLKHGKKFTSSTLENFDKLSFDKALMSLKQF